MKNIFKHFFLCIALTAFNDVLAGKSQNGSVGPSQIPNQNIDALNEVKTLKEKIKTMITNQVNNDFDTIKITRAEGLGIDKINTWSLSQITDLLQKQQILNNKKLIDHISCTLSQVLENNTGKNTDILTDKEYKRLYDDIKAVRDCYIDNKAYNEQEFKQCVQRHGTAVQFFLPETYHEIYKAYIEKIRDFEKRTIIDHDAEGPSLTIKPDMEHLVNLCRDKKVPCSSNGAVYLDSKDFALQNWLSKFSVDTLLIPSDWLKCYNDNLSIISRFKQLKSNDQESMNIFNAEKANLLKSYQKKNNILVDFGVNTLKTLMLLEEIKDLRKISESINRKDSNQNGQSNTENSTNQLIASIHSDILNTTLSSSVFSESFTNFRPLCWQGYQKMGEALVLQKPVLYHAQINPVEFYNNINLLGSDLDKFKKNNQPFTKIATFTEMFHKFVESILKKPNKNEAKKELDEINQIKNREIANFIFTYDGKLGCIFNGDKAPPLVPNNADQMNPMQMKEKMDNTVSISCEELFGPKKVQQNNPALRTQ